MIGDRPLAMWSTLSPIFASSNLTDDFGAFLRQGGSGVWDTEQGDYTLSATGRAGTL